DRVGREGAPRLLLLRARGRAAAACALLTVGGSGLRREAELERVRAARVLGGGGSIFEAHGHVGDLARGEPRDIARGDGCGRGGRRLPLLLALRLFPLPRHCEAAPLGRGELEVP